MVLFVPEGGLGDSTWERGRRGREEALSLNKSKAEAGSCFLSKIETQTQTKERLSSRVSVSV